MKLTKHNNPNKRRSYKKSHSSAYMIQAQDQLYQQLAQAKTDKERDLVIKAYNITIRP